MKLAAAFGAALLVGGCASTPHADQGHAPRTPTEREAARVVKSPVPDCQPGHAAALANGEVHVAPGDTICVRLTVVGNVVAPVAVVEKFDPANTLVVRMWYSQKDRATYLYLHNPLHRYLRYEADVQRHGSGPFRYTDTCPVLDRRVGFEQWPYAIDALVIRDLVTLPAGGSITCE